MWNVRGDVGQLNGCNDGDSVGGFKGFQDQVQGHVPVVFRHPAGGVTGHVHLSARLEVRVGAGVCLDLGHSYH